MRLLNVRTYRVEEVDEEFWPKYAILSHTWRNEEILYEHLLDNAGLKEARNRKGWAKISYVCSQAIEDGFDWAWIDTCCIDKSSSAELSEAINSMFNWYRYSTICYVYLQDLSDAVGHDSLTLQESLRQCRWAGRGWTLQELIAPRAVKFYSQGWHLIGLKETLYEDLSAATGIDSAVLSGQLDVMRTSVAARMSWASNRATKRKEDRAYSLMGLFGVTMPLIYGEGHRKSFLRLQEEIMKASDDQSIFAWKGRLKVSPTGHNVVASGLLAPSPSYFRYSGDIIPLADSGNQLSYSMTNKGLSISLPLVEKGERTFVAILHCARGPEYNDHMGIWLHEASKEARQYYRINGEELISSPRRSGDNLVPTAIYVRHDLNYFSSGFRFR